MPLPMTSGWSLLRLWLLCSGDWREAFGTLFLHCSVALSRNRRGNELNFPLVNGGLGIREAQLPALGCDAAYLRSAGHADCGRAPRRCNGPVGKSRTAHCGCSCRPACQRPAGTRSQNCMWPRAHGCRKKLWRWPSSPHRFKRMSWSHHGVLLARRLMPSCHRGSCLQLRQHRQRGCIRNCLQNSKPSC